MVIKLNLDQIKQIFTNQPVVAAYLYGSAVEGKLGPLSDLDFGVLLSEEVPEDRYLKKRLNFISEISEIVKPRKVDVVILNNSSPLLAQQVISTGKLIFVKDVFKKTMFENRTFKKYQDAKFLKNVYYAYLHKRIEENKLGERYEK